MTWSTGIGRSSAARVNDGTQRSVTALTTPSAPSPTRAAANRSGRAAAEQVTCDPSARIRSSSSIWVASPPSRVPARTVTRPVRVSAAVTPVHRDRSRARPVVAAAGVNECPLPSARTWSPAAAAPLTAAEISAAVFGWARRAGVAVAVPAQFRHSPGPSARFITREYSYLPGDRILCQHVSRPGHAHPAAGRYLVGRGAAQTVRPRHRGARPAAGPGRPGRVRRERRRPDPAGRGPADPGRHQVAALPLPDRARPGPARLPGRDVLLAARSPVAARRGHQRGPAGRLPHGEPVRAADAGRGRGGPAADHDHGRLARAPGRGGPGPGRRPSRDPGLPGARRFLA